jgi:hypothetical protein
MIISRKRLLKNSVMGVHMEVSKKLRVGKTPLNGYMEDAYPLSVAVTNSQNYEWIYSNYIQLIFQNPKRFDNQPVKFFKLSCRTGYVWDTECPLLNYDKVTRNMLNSMRINIIDFICNAIEHSCYVLIYLDEFYLPYRSQFGKQHYIHESLFFGYDYNKKELYGLAYVTGENEYEFKEFSVSMDEVVQAYSTPFYEGEQKERVTLLSCNHEKFYEFDILAVKNQIYEYINSIQSDQKYCLINNPKDNYIFGISVYDELVNYYSTSSIEKSIIPLHIIYEHKKVMLDRILFMIENNYIEYNESLLIGYKKIITDANISKEVFIKYYLVQTEHSLQKLINIIKNIKEQDMKLMGLLYELINVATLSKESIYMYSRCGFWNDIAYDLNETLLNRFEIIFRLYIINNKSKGYIKLSNEDVICQYCAPITLIIDAENEQFSIEDNEEKIMLSDIKCTAHNMYKVKIFVDLKRKLYSIELECMNQNSKYLNINFMSETEIKHINKMIVFHENSYRFAISDITYCKESYLEN